MRVHLVSWDPVDARARQRALEALGHTATWLEGTTGTPLMRALRASDADVFLIDLGRRPSHGREVAMALRSSPATRHRPLVFAGGDDEATARMRGLLPDATYSTWGRLKTALPKALKAAPATPVVPPDRLFSGRTLAQKLGVAAGETVAVVGAPPGFADLLGPLPADTRLSARAEASCDRLIWFVRSQRELQTALGRLAALVTTQVAWLAWPKAASGVKTDLNGNDVRESGLAAGLVDFKVCSIDPTWAGLAFKRRTR
jgi:CheY-like chemotaxis protein